MHVTASGQSEVRNMIHQFNAMVRRLKALIGEYESIFLTGKIYLPLVQRGKNQVPAAVSNLGDTQLIFPLKVIPVIFLNSVRRIRRLIENHHFYFLGTVSGYIRRKGKIALFVLNKQFKNQALTNIRQAQETVIVDTSGARAKTRIKRSFFPPTYKSLEETVS